MDYYKDIWTKAGGEGTKFWDTVDFNHPDYKKQEQVFRGFLRVLKASMGTPFGPDDGKKTIESVLELGAGTGRMTKIMFDVFNPKKYYTMDIKLSDFVKKVSTGCTECDITESAWQDSPLNIFGEDSYDFILASEVFMHIKPEDIQQVIRWLSHLLAPNGGTILNIDWTSKPEHSTWCYIHDYDKLYRENGLRPIFEAEIPEIKQKLFCYGSGV